jgi:hypothetical protein
LLLRSHGVPCRLFLESRRRPVVGADVIHLTAKGTTRSMEE